MNKRQLFDFQMVAHAKIGPNFNRPKATVSLPNYLSAVVVDALLNPIRVLIGKALKFQSKSLTGFAPGGVESNKNVVETPKQARASEISFSFLSLTSGNKKRILRSTYLMTHMRSSFFKKSASSWGELISTTGAWAPGGIDKCVVDTS